MKLFLYRNKLVTLWTAKVLTTGNQLFEKEIH